MPELPEVESVAQALRHCLLGRRLTGMRVRFGGVLEPSAAAVRRALVGRALSGVRRHGKYLRLEFTEASIGGKNPGGRERSRGAPPRGEPRWLGIHLRMTGQLFADPGFRPDRHTHVVLDFDGLPVFYRDIRKFGRLTLLTPAAPALRVAESAPSYRVGGAESDCAQALSPAREPAAAPPHVGPDMLEIRFALWHDRVATRRAPIKVVLLDQRVASGLGNIYADEALHRARVHPLAPAATLDRRALRRLFDTARAVLRLAIKHGGTTYLNFVDFHGQPGNFRRKLRVYQRTGEPCTTCGTPITRAVVGGRSSHFCPRCQPFPVTAP